MDASTLELRFENGIMVDGFGLVIGADGAWSKVRLLITQMLPLFSGTTGYNLVILNAKEKIGIRFLRRQDDHGRVNGRRKYICLYMGYSWRKLDAGSRL